MAIWPASLPQHWLLTPEEESDDDAVIHTKMETGPDMSRQRYDADIRRFRAEIEMNGLQRQTFDTFWSTTIKRGSLPFDWYDPTDGGVLAFKLLSWRAKLYLPGPGASTEKRWRFTLQLKSEP